MDGQAVTSSPYPSAGPHLAQRGEPNAGSASDVGHEAFPDEISDGTLLGGRVIYRQFRHGYRTGLEPVLMAALTPARNGERVIEAGCGAGAGLLCLTERIPDLTGVGVEIDPGTAALATANFTANGRSRLTAIEEDILASSLPERLGAMGTTRFDHALANPPWWRPDATASSETRRDQARRRRPDTIPAWVNALARLLKPKGSLTLALPAELLAPALAACEAHGIGSVEIIPLWPEAGKEAKLTLLRGRLDGRAGSRMLAGLTLHLPGGEFTADAQAVLREGHGLYQASFRTTARTASAAAVAPQLASATSERDETVRS
ncbi:tRNA1(Val) (adenine(37)-N6)-methyltransferase [Acetobacter sacchari]|uniref:tRNA1(Val) (adenine(37)-N6)-methyltransferase n=1 Tax=Acetobacter sacchari TaxID=2661687 RepID=UPI001FAEEB31|nr:N-6 DNA methylase [Acetobacter sacchari]